MTTMTHDVTAPAPAIATATATATPDLTKSGGRAERSGEGGPFKPVPVWFFAFEGVFGASYDVLKSASFGWVVVAAFVTVNIVLARTVMRGRLKTARAMLRNRRTRGLAVALIGLRVGVHFVLGAIGMEATSGAAHAAFAVLMCATTVAMLAFDQRVMLRALNAGAPAAA